MPGITTTDNSLPTTDEKPKSAEQTDLEEAETALSEKDHKTARPLLEKLGKSLLCSGRMNEHSSRLFP